MSQLAKLKSAVAPSGSALLASRALTTSLSSSSQRRPLASAPARPQILSRPVSTAAAKHAPSTFSSDVPAASSSSSSSSSSSAPHSALWLLGLAGAGGLLLSLGGSSMEAEAAAPQAELPVISLEAPAADSDASAVSKRKKKKKKRSRGARRQLPYPGKFANLHRDAQNILQLQISQGLKVQLPVGAFPHDPQADKSVTFIPILEMGGPNGAVGQMVVQTTLGRQHLLESYADTAGNAQGSYKYTADSGLSVKPSAQVTAHGNGAAIELDYKMREAALSASLSSGLEFTASYSQALTPNLVGGLEFHAALMQFAFLNGGLKYMTPDQQQQLAISKRDSRWTATYYHLLAEHPHVAAAAGYPPLQTAVGLESSYTGVSGKSELMLGLRTGRHTYNWQTLFNWHSLAVAFDSQLLDGNPNIRWGANAQVNYDGSGESVFGLSLLAQF